MKDKSVKAGNWPCKLEWLFVTLLPVVYLYCIKMQLSARTSITQFATEINTTSRIFMKHPVTTWKMLILAKHMLGSDCLRVDIHGKLEEIGI